MSDAQSATLTLEIEVVEESYGLGVIIFSAEMRG